MHFTSVSNKFKAVAFVISLILIHPKIRKAFISAIKACDYDKLRPDAGDKYWMCVRTDYDYFGKTSEQRRVSIKVPKPMV